MAPLDTDVVFFGSLARGEWTSGSDVDWTLLVDGAADADHRILARKARDCISNLEFGGSRLKQPGPSGTFGNLEFSHSLLHQIGGQDDTNRNTTQRILLLLESRAMRGPDPVAAHGRVVRSILDRYLRDDTNLERKGRGGRGVPRFLLNDVVRFWRTMCVDFARKRWEQPEQKWALRNVKLRMSRKLLFVAGLLTVFSCYRPQEDEAEGTDVNDIESLHRRLIECALLPPCEVIARQLERLPSLQGHAAEFFDLYDQFIADLNDCTKRVALERLRQDQAYDDATFSHFRELSHSFQGVIDQVFLQKPTPLRDFTLRYGVF